MYWNLIWKSLRFVPFWAHLMQYVARPATPVMRRQNGVYRCNQRWRHSVVYLTHLIAVISTQKHPSDREDRDLSVTDLHSCWLLIHSKTGHQSRQGRSQYKIEGFNCDMDLMRLQKIVVTTRLDSHWNGNWIVLKITSRYTVIH